MNLDINNIHEERNKNVGLLITAIVHVLLTLLCLFYVLHSDPTPDSNQSFVLVEFENDIPDHSASTKTKETSPASKPVQKSVPKETSSPNKKVNSGTKTRVEKAEVIASSKPNNTKTEEISVEEKNQKKLEGSKSKFSDLLKKSKSSESNSTTEGDSQTHDDVSNIVNGKAKVGKGLKGRSVKYEPTIHENSQKTGKVAVEICINKSGKVIDARYTQKGSTTSDSYLVKLAKKAALKYVFSEGNVEKQCGVITIDFKLK